MDYFELIDSFMPVFVGNRKGNSRCLLSVLPKELIREIFLIFIKLSRLQILKDVLSKEITNISENDEFFILSYYYWTHYLENKNLKNIKRKKSKYQLTKGEVYPMSQHKLYDHSDYYVKKSNMIGLIISLPKLENDPLKLLILNVKKPVVEYCWVNGYNCTDIYLITKFESNELISY